MFRVKRARWTKKAKFRNKNEVLKRFEEFLKSDAANAPVEILCSFWKDQQSVITYKELRQAVADGYLSQQIFRDWQQDYSKPVSSQLSETWKAAMSLGHTGQPIFDGLDFEYNSQSTGALKWINQRGASFVTASTQEQKEAIAALLEKKTRDEHSVDELARLIRPCIGLTEGQAKANVKYYDSIVTSLKKDHPRMSKESAEKKARTAAQKYAERQQRERAMLIELCLK